MQLPSIRGLIDRRLLINFQVDPQVLARLLPEPFRPLLVGGQGMAGVCLIRLAQIRPRGFPRWLGIGSENAAHRIAVEWDQDGTRRAGVYIPRRDTSSRLNTLLGGRLFSGVYHHASFRAVERDEQYELTIDSDDRRVHLAIAARVAKRLPAQSIFRDIDEASAFFQRGSLGYSATRQSGVFDAMELESFGWRVEPLAVERVASSFFDDRLRFPAGSVRFDSALRMQRIEHEWHNRPPLVACGGQCVAAEL
jgi:hypothetical protein